MAARKKPAGNSGKTAKPRGRPFEKGKSGNPNGRPPVDPDIKAALKAATPQAVARLVELIYAEDESVALKACIEIINRELGKTVEKHELELSIADHGSRLDAAIARRAAKQ